MTTEHPVVSAFQSAALDVPAYGRILREKGVSPDAVRTREDFRRLVPVLDKHQTFGRFNVDELCRQGTLGALAGVLTSSGHSGQFAFGLYGQEEAQAESQHLDDALDLFFQVRSRPTLLINCLPMGVKVHTRACTLAETSVRHDMVIALVKQFAPHYGQVILVGETAFVKRVLEQGSRQGIRWAEKTVHVITGEEPMAENARIYLEGLLGIVPGRADSGLVASSMGVAELGLNLLFETPELASLRRMIHTNPALRHALLGTRATCVPTLFTYNPRRIYFELGEGGRLIATTLDPRRRLPLIRYATGDIAAFLPVNDSMKAMAAGVGLPAEALAEVPILMILGRGHHVLSGKTPVFPEQVKEGLYHDPALAAATTANFRLKSGSEAARVRVQLTPGTAPSEELNREFTRAMSVYVSAPLHVTCEGYAEFGSGMALDFERKFAYLDD